MSDKEQNRKQELSEARSKKSKYEAQRAEYDKKVASNNAKIKRLQAAKKDLKAIKARLEQDSKKQKKHSENEDTYYEWTGDKKDDVYSLYASTTVSEYKYYIETVDNALDAIVTEETTLENENFEMFGIIGKLAGWINSLASKIEKLRN